MKRIFASLVLLCSLTGCATSAADPAYVQANRARLQVVGPWLTVYGNEHAASKSNVDDVLAAWRLEVEAQARNSAAAAAAAVK